MQESRIPNSTRIIHVSFARSLPLSQLNLTVIYSDNLLVHSPPPNLRDQVNVFVNLPSEEVGSDWAFRPAWSKLWWSFTSFSDSSRIFATSLYLISATFTENGVRCREPSCISACDQYATVRNMTKLVLRSMYLHSNYFLLLDIWSEHIFRNNFLFVFISSNLYLF